VTDDVEQGGARPADGSATPEGSAREIPVPARDPADSPQPGAESATGSVAELAAERPDSLETLAEDLKRPLMGAPVQRVTGLLIIALVLAALLIGFTALQKQGKLRLDADGPPVTPGPSAGLVLRIG
jgi:hypothetical protein